MKNVAVYGASGYAGQALLQLLQRHEHFEVVSAISNSMAGQSVNGNGLNYTAQADVDLSGIDLVFLCTPHGASAQLAVNALNAGAQVVDLSADFRLNTADSFATWYNQAHPAPHLLPTPYGLPEINRQHLKNTHLIANPGCYPTSVLLPLLPLAQNGLLQANAPIVVDAKSGVSGAGNKPKPGTHFVEVFGDLKPYNIGRTHRHTGEIEQELQTIMPDVGNIVFSPHLLPVPRGLLSTIYAPVTADETSVHGLLTDFYTDEPLVKVLPLGQTARLKDAIERNWCVMSVTVAAPGMVIIVSVIDNLLKGASSQAIQNANLMFDLPETTGLLEF